MRAPGRTLATKHIRSRSVTASSTLGRRMSRSTKPCASRRSLAEILEADEAGDRLDWARAEGPDPWDTRNAGAPCYEEHRLEEKGCRSRNQHALTLRCQICYLRMLYVLVVGRTGEYSKTTPLEFTTRNCKKDVKHEKFDSASSKTPRPSSRPTPEETDNSTDLNWKRFVNIPGNPRETDSQVSGKHAKEYALSRDEPPQWDGDPETWDRFQDDVRDYLEEREKIRQEEDPPTWDGDPDTLNHYWELMQSWTEARRDDRMSGVTSITSSRR